MTNIRNSGHLKTLKWKKVGTWPLKPKFYTCFKPSSECLLLRGHGTACAGCKSRQDSGPQSHPLSRLGLWGPTWECPGSLKQDSVPLYNQTHRMSANSVLETASCQRGAWWLRAMSPVSTHPSSWPPSLCFQTISHELTKIRHLSPQNTLPPNSVLWALLSPLLQHHTLYDGMDSSQQCDRFSHNKFRFKTYLEISFSNAIRSNTKGITNFSQWELRLGFSSSSI